MRPWKTPAILLLGRAPEPAPPAPRRRPAVVALPLLLAVLLTLPTPGAAQPALAPPGEVEVTVEPLAAPLEPGAPPVSTNATARVPCSAVLDEPVAEPVHFAVAPAPAWVTAVVTPSTVYVPTSACRDDANGTAEAVTELVLRTMGEGPAFVPTPVTVRARTESWNMTGRGNVSVESGFHNRVGAHLSPASVTARSGQAVPVLLEVANQGNDRVRVHVTVRDAPDAVGVVAPEPFEAPSRAQGAAANTASGTVELTAPTVRVGDRTDQVTLQVRSVHHERPDLDVVTRNLTMELHTKGLSVPAPAPVLVAWVLAGAAAIGKRLGSRWERSGVGSRRSLGTHRDL